MVSVSVVAVAFALCHASANIAERVISLVIDRLYFLNIFMCAFKINLQTNESSCKKTN